MFQFPGFASLAGWYAFSVPGCPIRTPADHLVRADPRSFSQLIASFVASESLGIPHAPLHGPLCSLTLDESCVPRYNVRYTSLVYLFPMCQ